jgi:hypothetical protein
MEPFSRITTLIVLAITASGCVATYTQQPGGGFGPPQVLVGTPGGYFPLYTGPPEGGPAIEPNLAAPPGFASAPQAPISLPNPASGAFDGTYNGVGTILQNAYYGTCDFRISVTNMRVKNGYVRFSAFHGRIAPNGGVRMQYGGFNWLIGRFDDGHFSGTYSGPECSYQFSLDRVGPP